MIPATKVCCFPRYVSILSVPCTHISLGMIHKSRPIFSTQFHPEAKGGPLDSAYLFDIYLESVQKYKTNQAIFQPQRDSRPGALLVDLLGKERIGVHPPVGTQTMQTMQTMPSYVSSAAAPATASAAI